MLWLYHSLYHHLFISCKSMIYYDRKYSTTWEKKPFLVKYLFTKFTLIMFLTFYGVAVITMMVGKKYCCYYLCFQRRMWMAGRQRFSLCGSSLPNLSRWEIGQDPHASASPAPPVLAIPSSSGTIQRGREREGSHVGWGQEGEAVAAPHAGWDTAPCSGGNGPPRPTRMLWLVRCRITRPTRLGGASPRSPVQFVRRCR